jgi:hypothetical protein
VVLDFPSSALVMMALHLDPWHSTFRSHYGIKPHMLTKARGLAAGQLAKDAGVNLETIRYYETIGLMPAPPRTAGGHRVYDAAHVRRLAFIRRGRDFGFSIDHVRALLT